MICNMKTTSSTIICLVALGFTTTLGQQPSPPTSPEMPPPAPPPGGQFSERLQNIIQRAGTSPSAEPSLTKFNLDFPGGTPKELVAAIEKALRRPLNAIIPDELAATKLPALKMNSVDVSQLFGALRLASMKAETYQLPNSGSYQIHQTNCGFKTEGKPTDDSIWYFFVEKPVPPPPSPPYRAPKICRFYSLAPYLDRGMSVDDITTAIETGWKMLGETSPPTISFHKDTKLLIAVGEQSKLETIDAVLKALEPPQSSLGFGGFPPPGRVYTAPPPTAKPAEKSKSEQ
jgi:hypothetical protein